MYSEYVMETAIYYATRLVLVVWGIVSIVGEVRRWRR